MGVSLKLSKTSKWRMPARFGLARQARRDLLGQSMRFGVVGGAATAVHVLIALLGSYLLALSPHLSNLLGYACAFSVSFFGHVHFTFKVQGPRGRHFVRFLVVSLCALATSGLVTELCISSGWSFLQAMGLVALIVPAASFLAAKTWAFARASGAKAGASSFFSGNQQ